MKLGVVISAYNEEEFTTQTLTSLHQTLNKYSIPYKICVPNDNFKNGTLRMLDQLSIEIPKLMYYTNPGLTDSDTQ